MTALLACFGATSPALATSTYYVDTQNPLASNSNPGTEALPYQSISGAANVRKGPGIILVVKPGTYRETIIVPASGSASDPYVFRAAGPGVIVDGADDLSDVSYWAPHTGTVYVAASVSWSPKQVFVDGVRLTPTTGSPDSLPANKFVFVGGGQGGLYVNLGGDSPALHSVLVGRRAHGFRASNKQYVTIEGFTVARTEDRGIYALSGAHYAVIESNTVTNTFRFGIAVEASNGALVADNDVGHGQDHGIALTANSSGCTLRNNESHHNVHPTIRQANGIYCNGSTNNRFEGNRLHHNQDSGLQLSTSSSGNLAIQNLSWSNGDHGFDILHSANATLLGCVAYRNYKDGFSIEGASPGARVHNCIGVNNGIAVLPADGALEADLWVDAQSSVGFQSDYNIWWNSTSAMPVKFVSTWYSAVSAFSAATGHDLHSLQVDPQFVDPDQGDFELRLTSPAIDAGHSGVTGWPPLDALGRPRKDAASVANTGTGVISHADRGALEYQADHAPIVEAPTAVLAIEGESVTFNVHAADPDGEALSSLVASALPEGATFLPAPGDSVGTFDWTPAHGQSGSFTVTFTAANALTGSAATTVTVADADRAPVVTVQANLTTNESQLLSLQVLASDADGDSILSLFATDLPEGATFTSNEAHTRGTFVWTPSPAQAGEFTVKFTATNALSGATSVSISVLAVTAVDPAAEPLARPVLSPSPIRSRSTLSFYLPAPGPLEVGILDAAGRLVRTLASEREAPAGVHRWSLDGRSDSGERLASGVYFYSIRTAQGTKSGRVVIAR